MKDYLITVALVANIGFLHSCRPDTSGARAEIDSKIGIGSTVNFNFSSSGLLHIKEAEIGKVTFRATSREFELQMEKTSFDEQKIQIIIENLKSGLTLTSDHPVFETGLTKIEGKKVDKEILSYQWNLTVPAGVSDFFLIAEPAAAEPFVFLAMGDIQNGVDELEDVIKVLNENEDADFMIFMGDVTMDSGIEEFDLVEEHFNNLKVPVFSTPGNHDVQNSAKIYHDYFGRASYSITHKGARFSSLDSAGWMMSNQVWDWYKEWLDLGKSQVHILFSHIAATETYGIRGGHWRSRREANYFVAQASRQKVDAMFFGHLHTLDMYHLAGIPTFISGGAGAFEERLDGIGRHFLRVSVDPSTENVSVEVILVD